MHDQLLLDTQRRLRRRLFEGPDAIAWRPARELAAQLLLYLDDPARCWQIAAEWLRETLDADRVDGGWGGWVGADGRSSRYVVLAEARRPTLALPSVRGVCFDAADPSIRAVWAGDGVAAIAEVAQERHFSASMRGALQALGTAAKLALPVRDGTRPVGLICADWHRRAPRWRPQPCNALPSVAAQLLGPVLAASQGLAVETIEMDGAAEAAVAFDGATGAEAAVTPACSRNGARDDTCGGGCPSAPWMQGPPTAAAALTSAERRVAQLVAQGLSYKEIARRLDRSLSTVDHQLRSIRTKLGVRSTSRLVHLLSEHPSALR